MTDSIVIKKLLLRAIIGVNDDERINRQDVLVNLTLYTDTRLPGRSDKLADAVDYRALTKRVIDLVEHSHYFLVEKLAEEIAALCLNDMRISSVRVELEKPAALRFARTVGVCIERSRENG